MVITGYENERRRLLARECGRPLEAGKCKETDYFLEIPEEKAA